MKTMLMSLCAVSFFCVVLISCAPESTTVTDDSTLEITPDTLILAQSDSTELVDLVLSCGCGFTVEVTKVTGDTNAITYSPIGPLDETLNKHSLRFTYSPTVTPTGSHSVKVDFLAKKKTFTYTNSVVVKTL